MEKLFDLETTHARNLQRVSWAGPVYARDLKNGTNISVLIFKFHFFACLDSYLDNDSHGSNVSSQHSSNATDGALAIGDFLSESFACFITGLGINWNHAHEGVPKRDFVDQMVSNQTQAELKEGEKVVQLAFEERQEFNKVIVTKTIMGWL